MMQGKLAIATVLISLVAATGAGMADITMRLHTLVKAPHPFIDMANFMAEDVKKRSAGAIKIKIFDSGQLGKDDAVIGEMGLGTIDLIISTTNNAAKKVPEYQLFSIPYLFSGIDGFMAKVGPGTPVESYYQNAYREHNLNMRLLALGGSGTRNLSNSRGPVNRLGDIAGFKMRTPSSPMISKTWAALGTLPTSIAWGELYAAVQTGVAEALESSIPGYTGSKLYEVAPYLALTAHTIQANHVSISDRAWGKLSGEQQAMFVQAAQKASLLGVERAKFYEAKLINTLQTKHGVTVTRPDITEFQAALSDLKSSLVKDLNLQDAMAALNK